MDRATEGADVVGGSGCRSARARGLPPPRPSPTASRRSATPHHGPGRPRRPWRDLPRPPGSTRAMVGILASRAVSRHPMRPWWPCRAARCSHAEGASPLLCLAGRRAILARGSRRVPPHRRPAPRPARARRRLPDRIASPVCRHDQVTIAHGAVPERHVCHAPAGSDFLARRSGGLHRSHERTHPPIPLSSHRVPASRRVLADGHRRPSAPSLYI